MKHKFSSVNDLIAQKFFFDSDYTSEELEIIKSLRSYYDAFLNNYCKLIKDLDINNPIDFFSLFYILLIKGYLSNLKDFKISDEDSVQIFRNDKLDAINVILGKGVCRHTSALLSDLLNNYGLDSKQVGGYLTYKNEESKFFEKLKEYIKVCNLLGLKNTLSVPFTEVIATHSIVKTTDKDCDYFLDSLNGTLLIPSYEKANSLTSGIFNVDVDSGVIDKSTYDNLEYFLNRRINVISIFHGNKDMFDKFYKDNSDIYKDINNKARVLKKNIIY